MKRTAFATALAAAFLPPLVLPAGPAGGEFKVNSYTTSSQNVPSVAMDADGDFVVVWNDVFKDGNLYGIFAQRFTAGGVPLGGEIQVNTYTTGNQGLPAIGMDADGDFVVVWTGPGTGDTSNGIFGQRFAADGTPQGTEFRVNTYTTASQTNPAVKMDVDGDFVVVWSGSGNVEGDGIFAQRYTRSGAALGGNATVNMYSTGTQSFPAIAMDAAGNYVVAWHGPGLTDTATTSIFARRYPASGSGLSNEFRVNTYTTANQTSAAITMDADGDFAVVWASAGQDGNGYGVFAQRYAPDGSANGGEFQVNTFTSNSQALPSISMDADGDFMVTWRSLGQESLAIESGVYGRRYAANGAALSGEFRVNTHTTSDQAFNDVALDADGDVVTVWSSVDQDGSNYGIYAQRYGSDQAVDVAIDQSESADPAAVGSALSYTLTATNLATPGFLIGIPSIDQAIATSTGLRVVDTLPAGVTGVSAGGSDWNCTLPPGRAVCNYALALAVGEEASPVTVSFTPPDAPGSSLRNVARVSAGQFDPDLLNNHSVERTRLVCPESLIDLSAASFTVNENAGTATVTVTRSGGVCGVASVIFDTAPGSATAGLDFTDVSGSLNWANGEGGDKSFNVANSDDALDEISERLLVSLDRAAGATLGLDRARLIITDDDVSPRVNFTQRVQTLTEDGGLGTVTIQLSAISGRDVQVPLNRSGTATLNTDYFQPEAAITIPAGSRSASIDIEIADDSTDEPDETVILTMGAASGATAGTLNTHTLSITDNDETELPTVSFILTAHSVDETVTRTAIVQLSAASAQTVTVPFSVGGTATPDTDYSLSRSSPLVFNPGATQIGIQNIPVNDVLDEPSETVILTLGTPTNAELGANTVYTRTIVDNDPP